jgi:glycosyltransferase involved in cell wall biosynthesis
MIDILYLAFNRLEFTRQSITAMIANTDWDKVKKLVIYDDGSTDGTREYLESLEYPCQFEVRHSHLGSPVAIMNDYLRRSPADLFAKVDSDTMLPSAWLRECLKVMDRRARLDLLGIESFNAVAPGEAQRDYRPARFIGGIGLMRRRCFSSLPKPNGRFGFTQWQRSNLGVVKGWINPSLPVFLLDKLNIEPWRSLSRMYVAKGWQREWPPYGDNESALWAWWNPCR